MRFDKKDDQQQQLNIHYHRQLDPPEVMSESQWSKDVHTALYLARTIKDEVSKKDNNMSQETIFDAAVNIISLLTKHIHSAPRIGSGSGMDSPYTSATGNASVVGRGGSGSSSSQSDDDGKDDFDITNEFNKYSPEDARSILASSRAKDIIRKPV